ncbi:diguanylate cyclase [Rhodobacterales bacterium HKCCE2091]|nr:diguanylate cyclase [Rhodobacterales bacterium HKCCE2091]
MSGRILVVDSVAANRIVMKARLNAAFHEVETARSAADLARALAVSVPDLVILDAALPGDDPAALCRTLRADPATAEMPILVLCPAGDRDTRIDALCAGADDVLERPFGEIALFARIRALLREQAVRRDLCSRQVDTGGIPDPASWVPEPGGRIGLIAAQPSMALRWQAELAARGARQAQVLDPATVLGRSGGAAAHELYVIDGMLGRGSDGLQLLTELRARSQGRDAAVLMLLPDGDEMRAAAAFDLGAAGVLHGRVTPAELAARTDTLLRRKRRVDRLRAALNAGLELAVTDGLTGLRNRRYAMARLPRMMAADGPGRLAVMMLDLDHFKEINDRHGHGAGDRVLAAVARRLADQLRADALVARIGGEEFLVAVPVPDAAAARLAAERLRASVSAHPIALGGGSGSVLPVTVSIGAVLHDGTDPDAEALIARADAALYRSKRLGRNRVTFTDPAITAVAR